MGTPYSDIEDFFFKKLIGDRQYFHYEGLEEEEIIEIVRDKTIHLMNEAISFIYSYGIPDINLWDKDDENKEFNITLVKQEISLLADLMYFHNIEKERNKLKIMGITFSSRELNVFSPSNERKTLEDTIDQMKKDCVGKVTNYLARNRNTWEYKSFYGDN